MTNIKIPINILYSSILQLNYTLGKYLFIQLLRAVKILKHFYIMYIANPQTMRLITF